VQRVGRPLHGMPRLPEGVAPVLAGRLTVYSATSVTTRLASRLRRRRLRAVVYSSSSKAPIRS
jgi:hypothetical protein